jgi:hypothetical protein
MRESDSHVDANKVKIAAEYAEHQKKIANERANCDRICRDAMSEVKAIQEETSRLTNMAAGDRAAAAAMKARWEQKVTLWQQADKI